MKTRLFLAACAVAALSMSGLAEAKPSAAQTAAVADKGRPESDTRRDADRKPAQMLEFAGVKPGQTVADFLPGGGYFTRLFAKTVGAEGKVFAIQNPPFGASTQAPPVVAIAADPQYGNITVVMIDQASGYAVPEPVDVFWTSQNFHDLYLTQLKLDVPTAVKKIYDSIKPGGLFIVLDHAAAPGAEVVQAANTLHRIDPAAARTVIEAAGFQYEGETKVLANPADDHTKGVFDPTLRGHTDQFVYKFRKPK